MKGETLTFEILRRRHGDIEAMQILNVIETMAYVEDKKKTLLATPADRFVEAMTRLMATEMDA